LGIETIKVDKIKLLPKNPILFFYYFISVSQDFGNVKNFLLYSKMGRYYPPVFCFEISA